MRLGQLARKLALPPSEITAYLASQQIQISDDANARIDENHVTVVLQRFAPDLLNAQIVETDETPVPEIEVSVHEKLPAVETESIQTVSEEPVVDAPVSENPTEDLNTSTPTTAEVELIKAPKVALAGLKVLGKIELPEKKKKPEATATSLVNLETPAEGEQPVAEKPAPPQRERRKPDNQRRDQRDQRPRKNPVALAREREARAAEEKRLEEQRLRKEQRTQNYMKRVQAKAPTKAAKLVNEDLIDMSHVDMRPEPKTWIGKFWRWFRS